jgi:hypothetical protein
MPYFKVRDLMINVLPEEGGFAEAAACCEMRTVGFSVPGPQCPQYSCGNFITCPYPSDCQPYTLYCGMRCPSLLPYTGGPPPCQPGITDWHRLVNAGPEELAALKQELRRALGRVEAHERVLDEVLQPQTEEDAALLEEKLTAALEDVRARRATLRAQASEDKK